MISPDVPEPAYVQLADLLRARIADGTYTARLPSERDLVGEFGLAPLTVRKSMRLLAGEGLIRTVPGRGSFVARSQG